MKWCAVCLNSVLASTLVASMMLASTAVAVAVGDEPVPGKQVTCQLTVKMGQGSEATEKSIRYWLFVPANYASQKSLPLMVFLHGSGERGDDLERVKTWGPCKIVEQKSEFPFILVSPQCPSGERWDADLIAHLTDHVAGELKVDRQRMYITGLSMGGHGTWRLLAKHPKLFAAAVPICGGGDPADAAKMTHIPIWAFHGEKDSTVPLSRSQEMVEAVNKAGGQAKLTVYPGVDHNSWSQTYADPEVYKWLLSHQR